MTDSSGRTRTSVLESFTRSHQRRGSWIDTEAAMAAAHAAQMNLRSEQERLMARGSE